MSNNIRVMVAAAGRGTRAGLPYPKTLFPIQGITILQRIMELLTTYDQNPTVIVSQAGIASIHESLYAAGLSAHLVVQPEQRGMGDAVLLFEESPASVDAEHLILVWGDIPFIQPATVAAMVDAHLQHGNDFTFATRIVDSAYTLVSRDQEGKLIGVVETRELGITAPQSGEREIGLFIFRSSPVMRLLRENLPGKWGHSTGEHGFLYIITHLVSSGFQVEALPVATELDTVSLNSMHDIDAYL